MNGRLHPSIEYHLANTLEWPSLRPLQETAAGVLGAGDHALLLAPTAAGKTEAAVLPLLSRALEDSWSGLSILYVCPLRALLNNLEPRLSRYFGLVGRRVGLWHGDVAASAKNAIRKLPPDLLLTTPESIEAMLISQRLDAHSFFGDVRAVVVDETHAFAGDDRGWHLAALLERLNRLAGREIQRVGLSATVGNPAELLDWLAGSCQGSRRVVTAPDETPAAGVPEVLVDWVGSLANAAEVIAQLHQGAKRLVFCDSRARVEELAKGLLDRGVTTYVSHSSLSREVRAWSESAFAEGRSCVIVATSTLELGIDIGDLDRVIQIDAPGRVSSFLQRMGRTGRRAGTKSNCLFLATHPQAFLRAAAVVRLWQEGFVEPTSPPPEPFHVLAQQLMALCLQESGVPLDEWQEWLLSAPGFSGLDVDDIASLTRFLVEKEILVVVGPLLCLGRESERRWERRNFMELVSLITESPLFAVFHGNKQLGEVDRASFFVKREGDPVLLLAGRAWSVDSIDWRRKRCWVAPAKLAGRSRWLGEGQPLGFGLCQSMRSLLREETNPDWLTERGRKLLAELRIELAAATGYEGAASSIVDDGSPDLRWWTFAGLLANASLSAALERAIGRSTRFDNLAITLPRSVAITLPTMIAHGELDLRTGPTDKIEARAVEGMKFGDCLPPELIAKVVAARWSDPAGAEAVVAGPIVVTAHPTDHL